MPIQSASLTSLVETDLSPAAVTGGHLSAYIKEQGFATYRMLLSDSLPTSTDEHPGEAIQWMRVYPIPAKDEIHVVWNVDVPLSGTLTMVNSQGQVMYQTTASVEPARHPLTLSLSLLPPGMYFLFFEHEKHFEFIKVLKI